MSVGSHCKISIACVVDGCQRCSTSCVCGDISVSSRPGPSWRPHSMLNLSGILLIEKMEQRFRTDIFGQSSESGAIEGSFCRRDPGRLRCGA